MNDSGPDPRRGTRHVYRALALVCLTTGSAGVVLPLVPTTPFLLLAAWAATRGAPELADRIRRDRRVGPTLRAWEEQGAIPRRARRIALTMLAISALVLAASGAPAPLQIALLALFVAVGTWIGTRPDPSRPSP